MENYCKKYQEGILSIDLLNQISEEIVAQVSSSKELDAITQSYALEQYARKEAWKRAYKEIPLPSGSIPLDVRRTIQEQRNDLAEYYYLQILEENQ